MQHASDACIPHTNMSLLQATPSPETYTLSLEPSATMEATPVTVVASPLATRTAAPLGPARLNIHTMHQHAFSGMPSAILPGATCPGPCPGSRLMFLHQCAHEGHQLGHPPHHRVSHAQLVAHQPPGSGLVAAGDREVQGATEGMSAMCGRSVGGRGGCPCVRVWGCFDARTHAVPWARMATVLSIGRRGDNCVWRLALDRQRSETVLGRGLTAEVPWSAGRQ